MLTVNPPKPKEFTMNRKIWANNGSWEPDRQCVGCQFAQACGQDLDEMKGFMFRAELADAFGLTERNRSHIIDLYPVGIADKEFQNKTTVANNKRDEPELIRLFAEKGIKLTFVD